MIQSLGAEQLMQQAAAKSGLDDFGDLPFREALDVLIYSLERDAKLDDERRANAASMIVTSLVKRLTLHNDRKLYPAIAEEVVRTPIFIVGLPRTGSTNLHGLMAQCEGIRAPRRWEMSLPSPPPAAETYATDPRIAQVHAAEVAGASAELKLRHPMSADRPEQCQSLNDHAFMNWALLAPYDLPTYRDWLLTADHRPSYETHKRSLQHLQWRHPGQWVLKYPKHIFALDALIAVYPDAKLIWTHRDPAQIVPSVASLIGTFRAATPGFDKKLLGRSWAAFEEIGLRRGLDMRAALLAPGQIHDVIYRDVLKDPAGAVEQAYGAFSMTLSSRSREAILSFAAENAKDSHGSHVYTAEEYGLSDSILRTTYRDYIDRFGLGEAHAPGANG